MAANPLPAIPTHTKEPWQPGENFDMCDSLCILNADSAAIIAVVLHGLRADYADFPEDGLPSEMYAAEDIETGRANMDRIIRCVNFCAGISDEELELPGGLARLRELMNRALPLLKAVEAAPKYPVRGGVMATVRLSAEWAEADAKEATNV